MKPEIKQRIEQIRNGEIPERYKKTKYGVFPSDWRIDKLGSFIEEHRELSNDIEKYPVYSSSRKGLLPQSQYYDKRKAVTTNLGYKIVPDGYVTYRHMSDDDIFHFNQNTTGAPILVSSEYPVFSCNKNSNLYFIISLLNESPRFRYYCRMQKKGGTRTRLYYKNLCQYITCFPPLEEQQKIARVLSAQDKIIECYEKKIEQLKQMKKYYLQNMFPKHGETVPKIRFKGFTEPCQHRKFGEVFEEYSEKNHTELPVLTIIQGSGTILRNSSDRVLHYDKSSLSGYKIVRKDDFILHLRSFEGGLEKANSDGIISPAYHTFHGKNTNTSFYYSIFRSRLFIEGLLKPYIYGIRDGKSIDVNGMKSIIIPFPSLEEQKVIGDFFDTLDTLINHNYRKYENEKKKKKALQQLLLTGIVRVKL